MRGRAARRGVTIRRLDGGSQRLMWMREGEEEVKPMISVTQASVPIIQHCRGSRVGGERG